MGLRGIALARQHIDWPAAGAVLVSVLLWASAFVGIRAAGADLTPGPLAFGRLVVGTAILGAFAAVRRDPMPRGRHLILVAAAGIVWFGLYNVALNAAERMVEAGTAAMLVNIGPLLIILLAGVFLREGFPPRLLVGAAVAFAGAILIAQATTDASTDPLIGWGVALCLVAALLYAVGVILEKPVLATTSALNVTFLACAVGALVTAPFGLQLVAEIRSAPASSVAWMAYLGVFPTAVGFTTWAFALGRTGAGRLGVTTYLVPPTAILLACILLGELPTTLAIVGGTVSIAGVAIARSGATPSTKISRDSEA